MPEYPASTNSPAPAASATACRSATSTSIGNRVHGVGAQVPPASPSASITPTTCLRLYGTTRYP
jgi:hypothetical protein